MHSPTVGIVLKKIALVIPLILVVCDAFWPRVLPNATRLMRLFHLALSQIPAALAIIVFWVLRWSAVGNLSTVTPSPMDNPLIEHGFLTSLFTLPSILGHYGRLLLYPISLSIDYGFNQIPVVTAPDLSLLFLGVGVCVLVWQHAKSGALSPITAVSLTMLCLPVLVAANPLVPTGSILFERYLYFPSVGFALLLSTAAHRFHPSSINEGLRRWIGWGLVAVVALGGGLRTVDRNEDWQNDETLFAAAVVETPNSVRANINYAETLTNKGYFASAAKYFERVLAVKSDYPNLKLARVLQQSGHPEKALRYFEATTQLNPGFVEAWTGLGALSLKMGKESIAENAFHSALALAPDRSMLHNQLGVIYQRRGDIRKAAKAYQLAIEGNYRHPVTYCNLGVVYQASGHLGMAREAFNEALEMAPAMPLLHFHIGSLEQKSGNTGQAIEHFEKFLSTWDRDPAVTDTVRHSLALLRQTS